MMIRHDSYHSDFKPRMMAMQRRAACAGGGGRLRARRWRWERWILAVEGYLLGVMSRQTELQQSKPRFERIETP